VIEGLRLDTLLADGLVADYRVYVLSSGVTTDTTVSNVCFSLSSSHFIVKCEESCKQDKLFSGACEQLD